MRVADSTEPYLTNEAYIEGLQYMRWVGSMPWTRWLINHWRRQEGKPPFRVRPRRASRGPT